MRPQPTFRRLPDWPERLAEIIEARRHVPFAWGKQDCGTLAADVVLAVTGADPMAELRGRYASEAEVEKLMPAGLEATAERLLTAIGAVECPVAFAQRGDVVLLIQGNMPTLGAVVDGRIMAPAEDGVRFLPLRMAKRAWAV